MKDALREELREEIRLFHEQTQQFINKQISVKDFKGFSGGFGSYAPVSYTHLDVYKRQVLNCRCYPAVLIQ